MSAPVRGWRERPKSSLPQAAARGLLTPHPNPTRTQPSDACGDAGGHSRRAARRKVPKTLPTRGFPGALPERPKGPPQQDDEHACSCQGSGKPRGGERGGEQTSASPNTSEWTRVSTLGPGDRLPGHARANRRCIHRSECAPQAQDPRPVRVGSPAPRPWPSPLRLCRGKGVVTKRHRLKDLRGEDEAQRHYSSS